MEKSLWSFSMTSQLTDFYIFDKNQKL
jgi:hypothetical protein